MLFRNKILSAVRDEWDEVMATKDNWLSHLLSGNISEQPFPRSDSGSFSLGPYFRFQLLSAQTGMKCAEFSAHYRCRDLVNAFNRTGSRYPFDIFGRYVAQADDPGVYDPNTPYSPNTPTGQRWIGVARALIDIGGPNPRSPLEFLHKPFGGPHAPDDFLHWVTGGDYPEDAAILTRHMGDAFIKDVLLDERFVLLKDNDQVRSERLSTLRSQVLATTGRPIVSVCARDGGEAMPNAMTAVARWLWENVRQEDPDRLWFYVPIAPGRVGLNDGRHASLVARLIAFIERRDPRKAHAAQTEAEVRLQVRSIKEKLSKTPCVFIFDGYASQASDGARFAHVVEFIRNEPLVPLLQRLVSPDFGEIGDLADPEVISATKFIVLGDERLNRPGAPGRLAPYCQEPIAFPPPTSEHRLALARMNGALTDEAAARLCDQLMIAGLELTETGLKLVEAAQSLLGDNGSGSVPHGFGRKVLIEHLVSHLLGKDPAMARCLGFISLAQTELRRTTMQRLLWKTRHIVEPGEDPSKLTAPDFSSDDIAIAKFMQDLLRALDHLFYGIIVESDGEHIGALHAEGRQMAYDEATWGPTPFLDYDTFKDLSYDIPDPGLRMDVGESFRRSAPHFHAAALKVLAEMALQQHDIKARHTISPRAEGFRFYDRLVQAVFLGVQAVSAMAKLQKEAQQRGSSYIAEDGLLPFDPEKMLAHLYWYVFRRSMERLNEFALTRRFGANSVKIELLRMIIDAFNQDEVTPVSKMVRDARGHLLVTASNGYHAETLARFAAQLENQTHGVEFTVRVDQLIMMEEYDQADRLCREFLYSLHVDPTTVLTDASTVEIDARKGAMRVIEAIGKKDPARMTVADAIKFIERLGVIVAERDGGFDPIPSDRVSTRKRLLLAHYYFRLASYIAAHTAGLSAAPARPGAMSANVMISNAIRLIGLTESEEERGELFRSARLTADILADHLHAFPAERCQLLIIESMFCRLRSPLNLFPAYTMLREAEFHMPTDQARPRIVRRFLVERILTLIQAARGTDDSGWGKRMLAVAHYDLDRLERLGAEYGPPENTKKQVQSLREKLAEVRLPAPARRGGGQRRARNA